MVASTRMPCCAVKAERITQRALEVDYRGNSGSAGNGF